MTQGYLVLATGSLAYVEMAMNLAASTKVIDPKRPICLVYEQGLELPDEARGLFDHLVPLTPDPEYPHVMNKIRVFDITPYDTTMFVDADCLLVKDDIDHWWEASERTYFASTGSVRVGGEWKGTDLAVVLGEQKIPYAVVMNAGVFSFKRNEEGRAFFRGLEAFYRDNMKRLNITNYRGRNGQSFEFYIGLYMGLNDLKHLIVPNRMENGIEHSWMVSTWRAFWCDVSLDGKRSFIYKADGFIGGYSFLPTRAVRLSPTFAHFIGLKPARTYQRLTAQFRRIARGLGR